MDSMIMDVILDYDPVPEMLNVALDASDSSDFEFEAMGGDSVYLEILGLRSADGVCEFSGTDEDSTTLAGYVGPYENDEGQNVCGALFTFDIDVLPGRSYQNDVDDPVIEIDLGDTEEKATIKFYNAMDRWTDVDTMKADSLFTDIEPNYQDTRGPDEITVAYGDSDDEGLQVRAKAGWSFYLEVSGLTASDGICDLSGSDEDSIYIFGYVGPYVNDDSENVCGVLFTLDSDVLTSEGAQLQLLVGDKDEKVTFTVSYALSRWNDKTEMLSDSVYLSYATPAETSANVDETDDELLAVQAEASDNLYLEVLQLTDSVSACELAGLHIDSVALVTGYVGPYTTDAGETACGVLITMSNDVLTDEASSAVQLDLGNGDQHATFILRHPDTPEDVVTLWSDKETMEQDVIYTAYDPTPTYSETDAQQAEDGSALGLKLAAEAGDTLYLEVRDITDSDSECELSVIDVNSVTVIGYTGPYTNAVGDYVCGALFTIASNVLTSGSDANLAVTFGNAAQLVTFTVMHPDVFQDDSTFETSDSDDDDQDVEEEVVEDEEEESNGGNTIFGIELSDVAVRAILVVGVVGIAIIFFV